ELAPEGALEDHIVANMARFVWRRDRLDILRIAKLAEKRVLAIRAQEREFTTLLGDESVWKIANAKTREELGEACDLVACDYGLHNPRLQISEIGVFYLP